MAMKIEIEYYLPYKVRMDEDAKTFVAYIPALRLYTQSKTEERLKLAVDSLITNFVGLCWERGILDDVMRERGMVRKDIPADIESAKKAAKQYIIVRIPAQVSKAKTVREVYEVPWTLIAGKQATAESANTTSQGTPRGAEESTGI